jgi:ribonucleoside-triphosphate reductase
MYREKYEKYRDKINFINDYRKASNAATGSKYDSNANVEHKNICTCAGELVKGDKIGVNRLLMIDKITEMWGEELADEYIRQIESHELYKHDETNISPYCVAITMYPFLLNGLKELGGVSKSPKHIESFSGEFINLVYAIAAQFAGAVATPEFLLYTDYFIRKD